MSGSVGTPPAAESGEYERRTNRKQPADVDQSFDQPLFHQVRFL